MVRVVSLSVLALVVMGCANLRPKENAEGKWGYVNRAGDYAIAPQFDFAAKFHEGIARVGVIKPVHKSDNVPYGLGRYVDQMKYGFIDTTGAYIAPPVYDHAEDFKNGRAWVRIDEQGWTAGSEYLSSQYGRIDRAGKFVEEAR